MERTVLSSVTIHSNCRLGQLLYPSIQYAKGQPVRDNPQDRLLRSLHWSSIHCSGPHRDLARRAAWNALELTASYRHAFCRWIPRHTFSVCRVEGYLTHDASGYAQAPICRSYARSEFSFRGFVFRLPLLPTTLLPKRQRPITVDVGCGVFGSRHTPVCGVNCSWPLHEQIQPLYRGRLVGLWYMVSGIWSDDHVR
jgi:hypothetical protein